MVGIAGEKKCLIIKKLNFKIFIKKISEKILFEGRWLLLKESTYIGSNGREVKWECVERNPHRIVLVIIAKLMPSNRHVLIKQYRPAINNYIISFPVGVSEDDDISKEALRRGN